MIDELIELLSRLIGEGFLTEDEAIEVLEFAMREGRLPEGWELPLVFSEAIPDTLRDRLLEALLLFANNVPPPSPDVAQQRFMDLVREVSDEHVSGRITLKQWQSRMVSLMVDYYAQQAAEGAQRANVDDEELFGLIYIQMAYLSRLADQTATGRVPPGQMRNRAQMYAGEGRAIFYTQQGRANAQFGWVEDYIAVDDRNTCGPCSDAEVRGPYLPGFGPMPGRICLGRGYCRCLRLPRYDPVAYQRLVP